jgi:hypothetical protein
MKRVGIYLRVSTNGQTTENQRRELEAVAKRSGWEVVGIYEDRLRPAAQGCHGAQGQHDCRLVGRSVGPQSAGPSRTTPGAPGTEMRPLSASTGDRYHDAVRPRDVSDVRRVCRVRARNDRARQCRACAAREKGVRFGRKPVKPAIENRIRELRAQGIGILKIGRTVGVGTSVVQRVLAAQEQ